jgi:hypothetical protein
MIAASKVRGIATSDFRHLERDIATMADNLMPKPPQHLGRTLMSCPELRRRPSRRSPNAWGGRTLTRSAAKMATAPRVSGSWSPNGHLARLTYSKNPIKSRFVLG